MLKNVQTLRFFAAFWVVLHHMTPPVTPFTLTLLPEAVTRLGFAGVDLFFVISGLIMAETTRALKPGWHSATRFLAQRFGRIYIGWWPFFFIYLVAAWSFKSIKPQTSFWGSFLLWPQDLMLYLLPITWTLSFELYFYVAVALITLWQRRHATKILGVIGLALTIFNIWIYMNGMYLPENELKAKSSLLIPFYASPLVIEFIAGFLMAEFIRRYPKQPIYIWAMGAIVFLIAAYFYQIHGNLNASGMAGFFHAGERAILFGGFSCCLVACAMELERRGITPLKALQSLGDASYSIYLAHIMILIAMSKTYHNFPIHLSNTIWAISTLAATLIFSWLWYQRIELPLYHIFKRKISTWFGETSSKTAIPIKSQSL